MISLNLRQTWEEEITALCRAIEEEAKRRMNTDPKQSARPCGCDPGADYYVCERHRESRLIKEERLENHGREIDGIPEDMFKKVNPAPPAGFITKDSGERKQFASGMQRDTTTGKLLFHLVRFGPMFLRWVSLMTRGASKYEANNWMKAEGVPELKRFTESADRHFAIWMEYRLTGRNIEDPANPSYAPLTEDHAAAVFFNINGAEYVADRLPKMIQAVQQPAKTYGPGDVVPGGGTLPYDAAAEVKRQQDNARIDAEIQTLKARLNCKSKER
jgi:hypothetical protein